MQKKRVYLIDSIEQYGQLMAFCIDHDISVFRTYWDEREKGKRCYEIDWNKKRCFYASISYYHNEEGADIVRPLFLKNKFGKYFIFNGD